MSQMFSPRNILRMLWRRALIIMLILAIGLPMAVWYALKQDRLYEAIAAIQIEAPEVTDPLTRVATSSTGANTQLDLIQQKLMSRDHMTDVIARLGLFEDVESSIERVGLLRGAVSIEKLIDPAAAFRPDVQPSGLIITVRLGDAVEAANVANDFLNAILAEAQTRADGRAALTLAFFNAEQERVGAQILTVEAALSEFKIANTSALPENIATQRDRIARLRERRGTLENQLIDLEIASERLRAEEVARQRALLDSEFARIDTEIALIEAALQRAPDVERQLSALIRELTQLEGQFAVITTSRTEAAMAQTIESQDQAARFEVLETALVPEFPVSASRRKLAMAGAVGAGLLALGVALLFEVSNPVIRNAAQLEKQLGIRAVVTIPHLQGRVQRRRRKAGLWALLLLLLGGLVSVAWWFRDRLGELIGQVPWARLRADALGRMRLPLRG